MLVGHWGCGKTHYINGYMKRRAKQLLQSSTQACASGRSRWDRLFGRRKEPLTTRAGATANYLYASFFGADTPAAISDQFLSQLYPSLNSTLGKVLGAAAIRMSSLGAQLASAGTISDVAREEDLQAIKRWLSNPKDRVLVFDDLERSGMPIELCLSIINSYVERDGLKVIVLANEAEIDASSSYARWKEKVIGKTIRVVADPESVLDSLLEELSEGPVKDSVRDGRAALLSVMAVCSLINYRSVRSLAFDVQRIVDILDCRLAKSREAILEMLKFSIAVGGEFRSGRLNSQHIELVQRSLPIKVKEKSKLTDQDAYILDLEARFSSVLALDSIIPATELCAFWRVGSLDIKIANDAIARSALVMGVASQPAWQRLWEFRRLPMKSYNDARADLLSSLKRKELYIQGEILHVVGIAIALDDYGVGLFPDFENVHSWVAEYASDPDVFDRLERSVSWLEGVDAFAGLGFHKRSDPRFVVSFDVLNRLISQAEQKRLVADIPNLLQQIRARDYSNVYSFGPPGSADGNAWLHLVPVDEMANLVLDDGAIRSTLFALLAKRYSEDMRAVYRVEWRWLRLLKQELDRRIILMPEPFRSIAFDAVQDASTSLRSSIQQAVKFARRHALLERRRT